MKTVVGLFDEMSTAQRVVSELVEADVPAQDINLVAGDAEGRYAAQLTDTELADEVYSAAEGAVAGGVLGGILGLLVGLGALVLPGLGPVLVAGPLASALVGTSVGAAGGGLVGALVEWGVSREEAEFYLEGVRRGGVLVAVQVPERDAGDISAIMQEHKPVDIVQRAEAWRDSGWTGFSPQDLSEMEFDTHDKAFRKHYEKELADTQFPYANYTPAYRFGYFLSAQDRFVDRDWSEMEPEARRIWEAHHDEPWNEHKGAIQFSWQRAQTKIV